MNINTFIGGSDLILCFEYYTEKSLQYGALKVVIFSLLNLSYFSVCSYIQYSSIAAKLTRRALKPALRVEALKREATNAKPTMWKDGKAVSQSMN